MKKYLLAAVLAVGLAVGMSAPIFAAEPESVVVTIKGVLQEDKNGFFVKVDGTFYDVVINDESKADMHKFFTGLEGDMVKITGSLHVQDVPNGKPSMIVYSNDISRLKGEKIVRNVIVGEPVIVREHYYEHPRGINLPGIHINW